MEFGISMSLCTGEIVRQLTCRDPGEAPLNILEDFFEFALENGFGMIETASVSFISADMLFAVAEDIRRKISPFKAVIHHLPSGEINIASLHQGIRRASVEETKKHILLCQQIGVDKVVMHPGCFVTMPIVFMLLERETRETVKQSIFEIFQYCQTMNIELSIENLPRNEPFFQRPAEFEPFVEKGIGIALDTVHALISGVEPSEFISKFGNEIKEIHLTDGFREDISHCPIGTGEVNCLAVLRMLTDMNYAGRIILEVDSKKDLLQSLTYLREHQVL